MLKNIKVTCRKCGLVYEVAVSFLPELNVDQVEKMEICPECGHQQEEIHKLKQGKV